MDPVKCLKDIFGYDSFRPGQEEIIGYLCKRSHVFAVMPTGSGKSLCYQIPPLSLSDRALVVSPLIALMDDQVAALQDLGIRADRIHSGRTYEQCTHAWRQFRDNPPGLLYMSPEKLMTDKVLNALKKLEVPVGFFIIDEAHCISKWGPNFRPEYSALSGLLNHFPDATIGAFTATADAATQRDIVKKLTNGKAASVLQGFDRPNLQLSVEEKVSWKSQLSRFLKERRNSSGIVYCLSRKQTEGVAHYLNSEGFNAIAYHAGMNTQERRDKQDQFMTESAVIMVATIAFGMGIDKPDIRFVVHASLPGSMESYYQEIGRAGRDGKPAETLLLFNLADLFQRKRMIEQDGTDEEHKLREQKRLDSLIAYCEAPACRRLALLHYFGEKIEPCGNCDNCISPPMLIDGTDLAKSALSTIKRTGESFGAGHIVDVLRGARTEKMVAKGHDQLSFFGSAKTYSTQYLQSFLRQLVSTGHATINIQKFGGLEVSDTGLKIMAGDARFRFRKIADIASRETSSYERIRDISEHSYTGEDEDLFLRLKRKRLEIAHEKGVPAFVVFADTVLHEMVNKKPKDQTEFSRMFGVGPAKLESYARTFLVTINDKP